VRWINDVWDFVLDGPPQGEGSPERNRLIERRVHQTIQRVGQGLERFSFNTAIAALMSLRNELRAAVKSGLGATTWHEAVKTTLLLMAPFTPHVAEELWARQRLPYSIHQQSWPQHDAEKAAEEMTTLVVQAGSKVIARIPVPVDISEDDAKQAALDSEGARKLLNGSTPKKVIFVPGRATAGRVPEPKVNIVV
jgi:leucyl-tRNA synthetase